MNIIHLLTQKIHKINFLMKNLNSQFKKIKNSSTDSNERYDRSVQLIFNQI